MKTIKKIFGTLCLTALAANLSYSQSWTQLGNFAGMARHAGIGFSIGNKGYLGTGLNGNTALQDFWEYDPSTDSWTQRANFGGGTRLGAVGLAIGNKGYVTLGSATYPSYSWPTDIWEYDPVSNIWTQLANFPALGRYTIASFVSNNKIYMGTGWRSGTFFNDFWEFDPATNVWTQKANFTGTARQSTVSFALGTKGYVGLGHNYNTGIFYTDFREYDPATNTWTQLGNFPGLGRRTPANFVLGNYGYVVTGSTAYPANTTTNDCWRYDAVTDTWTQLTNFPGTGRFNEVSFVIGCKAYMGTGVSSATTMLNDFWEFSTPFTSSFAPVATVCDGITINFTNNSVGATSYLWTFGDNSSSAAANPSHLYAAPGIYQVTLTATNGCGSASSTQTVTVNPNPAPVISPGSISMCDGDSLPITCTPSIPADTYLWNTGETTQSIYVSISGTFTVTVTNSSGCTGTSVPITVTVNPAPVSVIVALGPDTFCAGDSTLLDPLIAYTNAAYQWYLNGVPIPGATNSTYPTSTSGSYTLWISTMEGCVATSAPFIVVVNPLPTPVITPDGPLSFCSGGSVNLTASGGTSYLWSTAATTASIAVNTSGTYTVMVTDVNNCSATASETVTVHPLPSVTLSPPGPLTVCGNNTITLNASSPTSAIFTWYQNNVLIPSETGSYYTTSSPGSYYVVVTDSNGCTASSNPVVVTQGNSSIEVTVASSLAGSCRENTIFIGYGPQSATLTANSTGAVAYLWSTGATTQSITVTVAGTYSVTVWDAGGCVSPPTPESQITIEVIDIRCGHAMQKILFCHVPVGNPGNPQTICIAPQAVPSHLALHPGDCVGPCSLYYRIDNLVNDRDDFIIYPNPFSNSFVIRSVNASEIYHLNLYNVTGQLIISDINFTGSTEVGETLSKGVYHVELISGDKVTVLKVVKL